MPGEQSCIPTTSEKYFLFDNISFFWDLIYLDNFFSFQGLDMERTDDTNRKIEDINWKVRVIITSRNRAESAKDPWKNGQKI